MFSLSFKQSELNPSFDHPLLRIEQAIDCDGSECLPCLLYQEGEEPLDLAPHYHLVTSQVEQGRRVFPIDGQLPG